MCLASLETEGIPASIGLRRDWEEVELSYFGNATPTRLRFVCHSLPIGADPETESITVMRVRFLEQNSARDFRVRHSIVVFAE